MKRIVVCALLLFCISYLQAQLSHDERVLQEEWQLFSSEYPSLTAFTSEEIAALANRWGKR